MIISAIILFSITGILLKDQTFGSGTQIECSALLQSELANGLKNGDQCAVWDGTQCRKGKYMDGTCTSEGNYMVLVCGILGVLAVLSAGVVFYRNRKPKA